MDNLIKLSDEQLKELQKKNLEIASYLVDFCKKNDLRVYLYAGALLGAVRHKGFIPWDDDIDMVMPYPDYCKLIKIWKEKADTSKYSLCYTCKEYNDHRLSSSIQDDETTFVTTSSYETDGHQGVSIDLVPVHASARTSIGRFIQLVCAAGCSLFKASRLPNRQSKLVYTCSKALLSIFKSERSRYFIWSKLEKIATIPDKNYEKATHVKEFTMFPYIKWNFSKKWFDKAVWVPFEDTTMPIPVGAKNYLKKRYGNFMELPPEKGRHPEHKILFMDLNTPYIKYRGEKYYCKNTDKNKK